MRRILKFPIEVVDQQTVEMHAGAQILTAQFQHGRLCLWAICDEAMLPRYGKVNRLIAIYGTGHPLPAIPEKYIATVQEAEGVLVWHIFEEE